LTQGALSIYSRSEEAASNRRLKKTLFAGCSKTLRYKAPSESDE
jgi:hypothetical protein